MVERVERAGLAVEAGLAAFVEDEALTETGIEPGVVWAGIAALAAAFGPKRAELLAARAAYAPQIAAWAAEHAEPDPAAYRAFLGEIGYLTGAPQSAEVDTVGIDTEIRAVAAPQLAAPAADPAQALTAVNARWASLTEALAGTDALGAGGATPERLKEALAWVKTHLDRVAPLAKGSWREVQALAPSGAKLMVIGKMGSTNLEDPAQFAGFNRGDDGTISDVFLRAHGLHLVLVLDRKHPVGSGDPAGLADVFVEAALTAVLDLAGGDKVAAYRTLLGLMKGDLAAGEAELNPDIGFTGPDGQPRLLKGRALAIARLAALDATTDAVLDRDGAPVPEHLLDVLIAGVCGAHDLLRREPPLNSPSKSVYLLQPGLAGPEETALAEESLSAVEQALRMERHLIKLGLTAETPRMAANLAAAIGVAKRRLFHLAGSALPDTVEGRHLVDAAIAGGLKGRAQIGTTFAPASMAALLAEGAAPVTAGATAVLVAGPDAAALQATHFHAVDAFARLYAIAEESQGGTRDSLDALLPSPA